MCASILPFSDRPYPHRLRLPDLHRGMIRCRSLSLSLSHEKEPQPAPAAEGRRQRRLAARPLRGQQVAQPAAGQQPVRAQNQHVAGAARAAGGARRDGPVDQGRELERQCRGDNWIGGRHDSGRCRGMCDAVSDLLPLTAVLCLS